MSTLLKMDFTMSCSVLYTMASGGSAKALAPHMEHFVALLESGSVRVKMIRESESMQHVFFFIIFFFYVT